RNAPLWTRLSDADRDADRSGSLPSVRRIWDHTVPLSAVQRPDLFARELSAGRRAPSGRVLAAESPARRPARAQQRWRLVRRRGPWWAHIRRVGPPAPLFSAGLPVLVRPAGAPGERETIPMTADAPRGFFGGGVPLVCLQRAAGRRAAILGAGDARPHHARDA